MTSVTTDGFHNQLLMTTPTITTPLPDLDLCLVEGGEFMMGDESVEGARPAHRVRVSGFWMGKYPVTQRLWQAVMGNNPSKFKGERRPVERVSWNDTQEFLQKLNALPEVQTFSRQLDSPGAAFRLPTEAEWEYAARGGKYSQGYKYSGSDSAKQVAWHDENSHSGEEYEDNESKEVGLLLANELKLHDMSGNIWEWCNDIYRRHYVNSDIKLFVENFITKNKMIDRNGHRAVRGGSFFSSPSVCVPFARDGYPSLFSDLDTGFRIALPFA